MIELEKDIRDVQFELNEEDRRITNYKTASCNDLLDLLDTKNSEIDILKEELEDSETEKRENYRPITREEELS